MLARCLRLAVIGALCVSSGGEPSETASTGMSGVEEEWGNRSGCLSDVSSVCGLDADPSFPDLDLRFSPTWLRVVSLP